MTEKPRKKLVVQCPKCKATDWLISLVIDGERKDIEYPYYKCRGIGCDWEESKKTAISERLGGKTK